MATPNIDYAASYFKYKKATPIQGTPTNKSIKRLKTELRANASSVETDLGGGDHGYLGLILTDVEYARITPAPPPFIAPGFPANLIIPAQATQVEAMELRENHKESKRLFYECKNVEKALLRHVQDAVEEKYIDHLIDDDTQLIQADIPTVLDYLFRNYGKVPSHEVKEKESEILNMTFHPSDPMITLYNPIEKLRKLASDAEIEYTEEQTIEFGLTVIRNTHDFENALLKWHAKQTVDKTWRNFKSHFAKAQLELKDARGPAMLQPGQHHANLLASQIRNDMNNRNTEMLQMIQTVLTGHEEDQVNEEENTHTVNATMQDNVQVEMLSILRDISQNLHGNNNSQNRSGRNSQNHSGGESQRRTRKTPDNARFHRRITNKYCWTHGGCAHESAACNSKANGHRDDATFANRMNGSNAFCPTNSPAGE